MMTSLFDFPPAHLAIWTISALVTAGVLVRPFGWPEAVWALSGAVALCVAGLIPLRLAVDGVAKGTDVYLFLIGMMALADVARREGLFDVLARWAVRHARGSATRLFTLIYLVATLVTVFLSNDATAVVMTPAVYAAARLAGVTPLPYLYICAFVANAASFVLPISNPANLVVYASHMPTLGGWLVRFTLPSLLAIVVTYVCLWFTQRAALRETMASVADRHTTQLASPVDAARRRPAPARSGAGSDPGAADGRPAIAAVGLLVTAVAILTSSALGRDLGLPTFLAGGLTVVVLSAIKRQSPVPVLRSIAWSVLPLVAGLFVIVEALQRTGVIELLAHVVAASEAHDPTRAGWTWGSVIAVVCNLVNNLPAGLLSSQVIQQAQLSERTAAAILIGVDLGPNLSITGSLATILWLIAIRREGQQVGFGAFLRLGLIVMPPALAAALLALLHVG